MGFDGFQNPPVGAQGTIARPVFKSQGYVPGSAGWAIFKNGSAEFSSVVLRGSMVVGTPGSSQVHIYSVGGLGVIEFPSGDVAESVPARITEQVLGVGATRVLATQYTSGKVVGNINGAALYMQSPSADGVTTREKAIIGTDDGIGLNQWASFSLTRVEIVAPVFVIGGNDILAAWTPYIVNWTGAGSNPAIGNGTLNGAYRLVGKTVDFRIYLQAGSTTTFGSGLYSFNPPFPPKAGNPQSACGYINDVSAASRWNISMALMPIPRLFINSGSGVQATVPFTFATSDEIVVTGTYEID